MMMMPSSAVAQALGQQENWFASGKHWYLKGDYSAAAGCFERAMQQRPGDYRALIYDAFSYQKLGQKERARALYQHAIAIFPDSSAAKIAKECLKTIDAPSTAVAALAPAGPTHAPTKSEEATISEKLQAGRVFHEKGDFKQAEHQFEDALHLAEHHGQLSQNLVDVLQTTGDYFVDRKDSPKAYTYFKREIAIRENMHGKDHRSVLQCIMRIAPTYVAVGELNDAEAMYRRCLPVYQKDYDDAIKARKRLTNERNTLIQCQSGLLGILQQKRQPHYATQRDEVDDLQEIIKRLQEEAARPDAF